MYEVPITETQFVSTYLGLVDLLSADAQGIWDAIVAFLSESGLDIKHLVGIATDGASVMIGKKSLRFHTAQTEAA